MKRSKFNLSHTHLYTANMGKLIPFACFSTLPGDIFKMKQQAFIRATPMIKPIMHDVKFITQWWYVPYRLLWDNWTEHITGGTSGTDAYEFPQINSGDEGFEIGGLADMLGMPTGVPDLNVSAMPFRAYSLIWNLRYRDEDLQDEVGLSFDDGEDETTNTDLLSPSWKKDYFTTARNSTQRGNEIGVPISAVDGVSTNYYTFTMSIQSTLVPISNALSYYGYSTSNSQLAWSVNSITGQQVYQTLGADAFFNALIAGSVTLTTDQATALGLPSSYYVSYNSYGIRRYEAATSWKLVFSSISSNEATTGINNAFYDFTYYSTGTSGSSYPVFKTTINNVYVNSSGGISGVFDVRTLRVSSAMQRFQERSLKYGNRYEEMLQREFGVRPRDSRIDRPEYIGGSMSTLQIGEVFNQTDTTDSPLGDYAGYGVAAMGDKTMKYRSVEHGLILGLMSIRPAPVYMQGCNREWLKTDRLEFYFPEFANIGMQEVYTGEIFAQGGDLDKSIFGYQDRYQEYRYLAPRISGDFKKEAYLDWHLGRQFAELPALNDSFINMGSDTDTFKRIFAYQGDDWAEFMILSKNQIIAYRPIPKRAKNILK